MTLARIGNFSGDVTIERKLTEITFVFMLMPNLLIVKLFRLLTQNKLYK